MNWWRWWLYGPRLAHIVVTRRCNIDCGYCNEYDKTSPPMPADRVRRIVDHLATLRLRYIGYTGGETLLHPDLIDLVAYASKKQQFRERWIITNGYLLSPDTVDGLNQAGLTHLQISVDGVRPNPVTVKVLKTLRRKLEILAERARFVVQVNAVLGASNASEAVEVVRTVRALGFKPRVSIIHDGHGAMSLNGEGMEALREIKALLGERFKESGDYRNRLIATGRADFKCRAGARYLYIDEFGLANWCSQQRGVFTKPILEYGWQDLKEQFHTEKSCAPTCTVGCVRTASRYDEWRSQSGRSPSPHRAPARNQETLIPASALRPRMDLASPARRSQMHWRQAQAITPSATEDGTQS